MNAAGTYNCTIVVIGTDYTGIRLTDKPWFSTEIRKRNKYSESLIPLTARGNQSNPSL
jgi:hypothetical protein